MSRADQNRSSGPVAARQPGAVYGRADAPLADAGALSVQRVARSSGQEQSVIALFRVHMFPIGHLPVPANRPAEQVPPPPSELDYAAGLRFPPADHPSSHMVHDTGALAAARAGLAPLELPDALGEDDPAVAALAETYDPLGGANEREWDRRFLVRAAEPEAGMLAEYAWPPGELFSEGGCDIGNAVVLVPGTELDRFGTPEGRVLSEAGTPFAQRSLPPSHLAAGYHRYQVTEPLPVWRTVSASWFAQSGGGVRYRAGYPVTDLIALGYLTDVTHDPGDRSSRRTRARTSQHEGS